MKKEALVPVEDGCFSAEFLLARLRAEVHSRTGPTQLAPT